MHDDQSPHISSEMKNIMGEHGVGPAVDDLLDGKIALITSDDDECMDQWRCHLEMMAAERQLAPVENRIDADAFATVFQEADEKKSSPPEGPHYILWKVLAEHEDFCKYMSVMLSMPFNYGFSVRGWENLIGVMIKKSEGVQKIHLMRIIGLVEADFNCALKILYSNRLTYGKH